MNSKKYIIDSLVKHFSNAKYAEYEADFIDNITMEGKLVGRKYFDLIYVRNREDLLSLLKFTKNGLMLKCMRNLIASFGVQTDMNIIEAVLQKIFEKFNEMLSEAIDGIEIQYNSEDLFGIVQQSKTKTDKGEELETLDNAVLLKNLIGLIGRLQSEMPQKQLIIFENIDHMINWNEFQYLFELSKELAAKFDTWFLFSASIDGYVVLEKEFFGGVNVINDEIYGLPELERMKQFIDDVYPCYVMIQEQELLALLRPIIQKIGKEGVENDLKSNVILKLINKTLCVNYKEKSILNPMESSFLLS